MLNEMEKLMLILDKCILMFYLVFFSVFFSLCINYMSPLFILFSLLPPCPFIDIFPLVYSISTLSRPNLSLPPFFHLSIFSFSLEGKKIDANYSLSSLSLSLSLSLSPFLIHPSALLACNFFILLYVSSPSTFHATNHTTTPTISTFSLIHITCFTIHLSFPSSSSSSSSSFSLLA